MLASYTPEVGRPLNEANSILSVWRSGVHIDDDRKFRTHRAKRERDEKNVWASASKKWQITLKHLIEGNIYFIGEINSNESASHTCMYFVC